MRIRPFAVEEWMNAHETHCEYNLAETCVESLTVDQLLDLAGRKAIALEEVLPLKLTYGVIRGSERLREGIAALYRRRDAASVLVAHGAIGANALVYQALVDPGDRVVSIVPNYQQHYSIPESLGADVRLLWLRERDRFVLDLDELRRLATLPTKVIALSNPNNPTGALLERAELEQIAAIADAAGAYVLCDEVYRGTTQVGDDLTPSIADICSKGISIGSMSKAFSLAGLRLGWMVASPEVLRAAEVHRDYNTISVSMLDDYFAAIALENSAAILGRSRAVVRTNLDVLDRWIAGGPGVSYVKPRGGTTALLNYGLDMPSQEFCVRLLEETGVMFTPGSAFDLESCVRIGYANNRQILEAGLDRTAEFLRRAVA